MNTSKVFLWDLLATGLLAGAWAARSRAQDPYAASNYQRAYRQFLNSPSPVRTFSSYKDGQVWGYDAPLQSGRYWLTPGYHHEEISPSGWQGYTIPQQPGGYTVIRPLVAYPPPVVLPVYPYPPPYPWRR